ncbi:putative transcriptional regulatory protein LevR [Selenomonas ruminantium subsp. lactilytica TAM6421]|uniref:Putative transcriptional regulatory protein LevR n=1 Tax=Selenomonas ruminantium subsp. lactilytica (strain NBRC 103574 / TAM6421) TaxID=927704 RepID=I0GU37_SELRL|nr:sigma-54-dependent transcriptional regulator [Selenomonas ruminantium]BAL84274.1 putative transcriptional regulatory protein LevR [Selenomonas ruminantium subsp. lactilytica TAM6421]
MKRSERIYHYIKERSADLAGQKLTGQVGFDAQEIASELDILRNNVSKELNELHRQDLIVKFTGRPVRYFDKEILAEALGSELGQGPLQFRDVEECKRLFVTEDEEVNPFARLIGANKSLKRQVEQGKAAILYPPDGLHTLIVGQTGVGKTLFAHMMFAYGKAMKRFGEDAPFITFNCADYYNNPQLLISHVFGHIKGAFTGADTAKAGLVEEADGGVLFLDEIHRLPPEGQEMIFYFMDTGTFNRLGETTRSRKAKVLIIGATTEDPNSALTKTFVRRIPNIITIKPLSERTLEEKLDILKLLFMEEAQRVKKPVRISVEAVKALIGSIGSGNVGQLKSNIKLLCAQAFLNGIDNPSFIEADFRMLPPSVRDGLLTLSANRQALSELTQYVSEPLLVSPPGGKFKLDDENSKEGFNLYQVVEDKVALLKGEGISDELIKQIVATDVNVYVKELYNKKHSVNMTTRERLLKIVDETLVDFSEQISLYVQKRLNRSYRDRFLYAFSLHLSAFLKRVKAQETIPYTEIEGAIPKDSDYMRVAEEIGGLIEQHYHVTVPRAEIEYIALLLESADDDELEEKITILVATHGKATASSMVDVAKRLFSSTDTNIIAIDMPLEVNPQDILEQTAAMLKGMECQKGVLILADMGSLCNIGALLSERLKIPVRTLDMVSTPLILEAMRKVDIAGMDLDSIYESLLSFKGYEAVDTHEVPANTQEAIVTICSSGHGAAMKIKALVEDVLRHAGRIIEVIPVGVLHLEERLEEIAKEYKLVAAVGMKKPEMSVPFIPLEQLIDGEGERRLTELVFASETAIEKKIPQTEGKGNMVVQRLCEESLQRFLTYLNPAKIMSVLWEFDRSLENDLQLKLSNPLRVRLLVHCGCALERVVTRSPLVYKDDKSLVDERKLAALKKAAVIFDETLKLRFDEDEYYFMANML